MLQTVHCSLFLVFFFNHWMQDKNHERTKYQHKTGGTKGCFMLTLLIVFLVFFCIEKQTGCEQSKNELENPHKKIIGHFYMSERKT